MDLPAMSIPAGAIAGIIGNNGSGKTTFARFLCGLEKKATGEEFADILKKKFE